MDLFNPKSMFFLDPHNKKRSFLVLLGPSFICQGLFESCLRNIYKIYINEILRRITDLFLRIGNLRKTTYRT